MAKASLCASAQSSIFSFGFGSHAVRVIIRGDEPWFVATDICAALDYKNTSKAVADHLDDDERSNEQLDRSRMGSKAVIINESGLYALVLRSRKPEARKFAKWVTGEVLPSIRKTGRYSEQQLALPAPAPFDRHSLAAWRELATSVPIGLSGEVAQLFAGKAANSENWPALVADPSFDITPELLADLNRATTQRLVQKLADAYEGMDIFRAALIKLRQAAAPSLAKAPGALLAGAAGT